MNRIGFVCFLLVLSFSSLSISLAKQDSALLELQEAINIAAQAEETGFLRSVLEENTDSIIRQLLSEEAVLCQRQPNEIKQRINQTLWEYFRQVSLSSKSPKIDFKASDGSGLSQDFLNQNSSLIVKRSETGCSIEYSFHGGLAGNNNVVAVIAAENFSQEFRVPAGYSQKAFFGIA